MPIYRYVCKCGWTAEFIKPPHKRTHICPKCAEPLSPRISATTRRWRGGAPD